MLEIQVHLRQPETITFINKKTTKMIKLQAYKKTFDFLKVGLSHYRKFLKKLKLSSVVFKNMPSFVCLVFKNENR